LCPENLPDRHGQNFPQVLEIMDARVVKNLGFIVVGVGEIITENTRVRKNCEQQENSPWPGAGKK
jgi:hypothetical protein